MFEALEPRSHLASAASFISATITSTQLLVVIEYTSDVGVNLASIDDGDIAVTRGDAEPYRAPLAQGPIQMNGNLAVRSVYSYPAPGGAWDYSDNDSYTAVLWPGEVTQTSGGAITSNQALTTSNLWFNNPRAQLRSTVIQPGRWLINVEYTDNTGIDTSTIYGDIRVTGPQSYDQTALAPVAISSIDSGVVVTYSVPAPGGAWDFQDNGSYSINLQQSGVADTQGNFALPHVLSTNSLWFANPRAQIVSTTVNDTDWRIVMQYAGAASINLATVNDGDIRVTSSIGFTATGSLIDTPTQSESGAVIAVYSVPARGGFWDFADNASYVVSSVAGAVADANGNTTSAGDLQTFNLWFNAPSATFTTPTSPTSTGWTFEVIFRDNAALNAATILSTAISVRTPGGAQTPSLLSTSVVSPSEIRATFRLIPGGGTFANGRYEIWTAANGVQDSQGNAVVAAMLASFWLWF